jgi:hypothetical protein
MIELFKKCVSPFNSTHTDTRLSALQPRLARFGALTNLNDSFPPLFKQRTCKYVILHDIYVGKEDLKLSEIKSSHVPPLL